MKKNKELKALPSIVEIEGSKGIEWEQLEETEKEELDRQISRNIEQNLSAYFASRPKEWETISLDH